MRCSCAKISIIYFLRRLFYKDVRSPLKSLKCTGSSIYGIHENIYRWLSFPVIFKIIKTLYVANIRNVSISLHASRVTKNTRFFEFMSLPYAEFLYQSSKNSTHHFTFFIFLMKTNQEDSQLNTSQIDPLPLLVSSTVYY